MRGMRKPLTPPYVFADMGEMDWGLVDMQTEAYGEFIALEQTPVTYFKLRRKKGATVWL